MQPGCTSSPAWSTRTSTATIRDAADWEGFAHGTAALAAGGTTTFVDMPLNASPPTLDGASFDLKAAAAMEAAVVDFALWGGLVPGDVDRLDELADRGVVGFKAFMCPTGMDDFGAADDDTLHAGMARAARLGLPVAVHAESAELTSRLAARGRDRGAHHDARLSRLPSGRRRARGDRAGDRDRPGDGLLTARRPRVHGERRPACRRRPRGRGRRHLRDLPALPRARRRGRGGSGHGGEVLAAPAPARRARRPLGRRFSRGSSTSSRRITLRARPSSSSATTRSPPGAASPAARRCCGCC